MDKIGIFCSASDLISPVYKEKAEELGVWLGQHKKRVIYGGSNTGLMEVVAQAAKANGAMLMGIVPTKLEDSGRVSDLLDINFHAVNLSDRKDLMLQESDVMVALPGGIGTLDEIFHVAASASIGYHNKKVILYNVDGFWDEMLHFFEKLGRLHFTHRSIDNYILVAGSFDELVAMLDK